MRDVLYRLYRAKLILVAAAFMVTGIFVIGGTYISSLAGSAMPDWLYEVGAGLITAGAFSVVLEAATRHESREQLNQDLRQALIDGAPAMRDAVIQGFAFNTQDLTRITSTDTLDQVIKNSMGIRFGHQDLANDVYANLSKQLLASPERHRDHNVTVTLRPWQGGPASGPGSMFEATLRREYITTSPQTVQRFSCVSNRDDFQELLLDPTTTEVHYYKPEAGYALTSAEVFELLQFSVNGKERPIRRSKDGAATLYTVSLGRKGASGDEMAIFYTYRVLIKRHGNLFNLSVNRPCADLRIDFRYSDCELDYVNVLDFLGEPKLVRVARSPDDTSPAITLSRSGWVLPNSGVAFVWKASDERLA